MNEFELPAYKVEKVFTVYSETIDWGLKMLSIPSLWRKSKGENIRVAILDTGIELRHPDLIGAIEDYRDFTNSYHGVNDLMGHGTHVAGIIAARQNNVGVIGVAPKSKLLIAKVLGDNGSGNSRSIVSGINWAIRKKVNIISMSLGSSFEIPEIEEAIQRATENNILVIVAAGNAGPQNNTVTYPGAYKETITVGSIGQNEEISSFSSRGEEIDIVAPGDKILSTYTNSGYAVLSGTSMATPFVSGVVALMLGAGIKIKNQQELINELIETSIDVGRSGYDTSYGFGLINPKNLISNEFTNHVLNLDSELDLTSSGFFKLKEFCEKNNINHENNNFLETYIQNKNQFKIVFRFE
jgi:subtilisin family serine protease